MKITAEERDSVAKAGRITEVIKDITSNPVLKSEDNEVDLAKVAKKFVKRRESNFKKIKKEE